jgi:acetolactate synthase-1/2/3 large subunit
LIVPANVAWSEGGIIPDIPALEAAPLPAIETIEGAAALLRSKSRTALLLTGTALHGSGLAAAGCIAAATKAKLLVPYPFARLQRGAGAPIVERLPYVHEQAVERLKEFRQLILVGTKPPVSYFAYPDKDSLLTPPECSIYTLAIAGEDCAGALDALAATFAPSARSSFAEKLQRPAVPSGEITLSGLATTVAALLPENAIVVDESMTSGRGMMAAASTAAPHDWLANTGGSIGIALPLAVGAAVACSGRRVLCLSADGSGMYTLQALWTMAREGLNVTTVIFANRAYAVLQREFDGLGVGKPGRIAKDLFDIGRPDLDWVHLAKGMGVPGTRIGSLDEFAKALRAGFACEGPMLIEVCL